MKRNEYVENHSGERVPPLTTRHGFPDTDSDSVGFMLVQDAPPDLLEATSRYQVINELGRGGMGIVYRARDLFLSRHVAIKVLLHEYLGRPRLAERFTDEARIMGYLQHPGIAHVFEFGHTPDGRPFHVMKLVEGKTMYSLLGEQGAVKLRTAKLLNVFSQVCQAMAYTHSRNIIHLDLKPNNIMVGPFGEVHVMDWGLARTVDASTGSDATTDRIELRSKRSNRVHGTLHYMAPEQAMAEKVDRRTDVFCLGAILCEILTGIPAYDGSDQAKVLSLAQEARLKPAFDRLDACDGEYALVRLAKNCLQANPDDRPGSATEVANEIASCSESALEQVEGDMTRFFELSLDLFCIAGFDGFFRRINSNFSRVLGYTDTELLARPFLDFVVDEDKSITTQVMSKLLDGQPVVRFRNHYRAANGKKILFEWTAKSLPSDNIIYAVARNVT